MRVYVLRHGKAERHSETGRDEDRPLADRGRAQAEGLAKLFAAKSPPKVVTTRPSLVLASPAVRADATARIIAQVLRLDVKHDDSLALDSTLKDHVRLVERLLDEERVALLVGHNPLLSRLVDHLAGGDELRTGEMSVLELETMGDAREVGRVRIDD
jgi:phosphohistidine phosphatase